MTTSKEMLKKVIRVDQLDPSNHEHRLTVLTELERLAGDVEHELLKLIWNEWVQKGKDE